eukprot:14604024-Alexandrium_andersonii.AAC.1
MAVGKFSGAFFGALQSSFRAAPEVHQQWCTMRVPQFWPASSCTLRQFWHSRAKPECAKNCLGGA